MLLNDAQQIIMQEVQHTFVEGPVGNYSSCSNRMELSLCSPEIDDCFNRTLTSIRSASIQSDSVSFMYWPSVMSHDILNAPALTGCY